MKRLRVILTGFIYSIAVYLVAQTPCRPVEKISTDLESGNYICNSYLRTGGFDLEYDPQYALYEELSNCATSEDLKLLMLEEHPVVQYYAILAFLVRDADNAIEFVFEEETMLKQKEVTEFLNYCQGSFKKKILDVLLYQAYRLIVEEKIIMTATNMVKLLQLRDRRNYYELPRERRHETNKGF
ncbi:MAG: hypothetical protein AAF433_16700 [Bacteroidota bacterium]